MPIGQQVVDRLQAGGAHVAGPCDLDRRRLAGEDEEPVVTGMARQVEEDVDGVVANALRQPLVAPVADVPPCGGRAADAGGDVIVVHRVVVADRLRLPPVEVLEHANDEEADRVAMEIGRQKSDPQRPIRIAEIGVGVNLRAESLAEGPVEAGVGRGKILGRDPVTVLERAEQVAPGREGMLFEGEHAFIRLDRLVDPPLVLEDVSQMEKSLPEAHAKLCGAMEGGLGLREPAERFQGQAEGEVGVRVVGFDRDGPLEHREGLGGPVEVQERGAEVRMPLGIVPVERHALPVTGRGGDGMAHGLVDRAEAVVKLRLGPVEHDRLLDQADRLLLPPRLVGDHAQEVHGVPLTGIDPQDVAIFPLRFDKPPRLMVLDGQIDRISGGFRGGGHGMAPGPSVEAWCWGFRCRGESQAV